MRLNSSFGEDGLRVSGGGGAADLCPDPPPSQVSREDHVPQIISLPAGPLYFPPQYKKKGDSWCAWGGGRGRSRVCWLSTNSPTSVTTAFRRCPAPSDQLKLTTSLHPMASLPSQNHSLVPGPGRFPSPSSMASHRIKETRLLHFQLPCYGRKTKKTEKK